MRYVVLLGVAWCCLAPGSGFFQITDMVFSNASNTSIRTTPRTASTQVTISRCEFLMTQRVLVNYCDKTVFVDSWVEVGCPGAGDAGGPTCVRGRAVFENHVALTIERMVGVPIPGGASEEGLPGYDLRWVDNWGYLKAVDSRFGGEGGGITVVVNKASFLQPTPPVGATSLPNGTKFSALPQGATIIIERCEVDSYGSARGVEPERRSNIWLEQIPSVLIVRDSQGFAYAPAFGPPANFSMVQVDPRLGLDWQTEYAAGLSSQLLTFDISSNNWYPLTFVDLPEQLRPWVVGRVYGDGPPTLGHWQQNNFVTARPRSSQLPAEKQAAAVMGWLCTAGGAPGTWATIGPTTLETLETRVDRVKTDDSSRVRKVNHSIVAHRVLLTEAAARDGALALDGSSGSYHIAKAPPTSPNSSKWHVHLQGGGWCWSVAGCAGRALGSKGSSNLAPNNHSTKLLPNECACAQSGYFSADPARNPTMHDWNHVHVNYVDGGSFSGNRSDPVLDPATNRTLYFRGKRILRAVLLDLLSSQGMDNATDIVLSGCSAGGLAVYLQADYVASFLPTATRLVAVPDSGYFFASGSFEGDMRNAATRFFDMDTNAACEQSRATKPGDCAFAQFVTPYVKTPIFAVQSIFDGWQMDAIARPPDWGRVQNSSFGEHCCRRDSKACLATVNRFGSELNSSLNSVLLSNPKNGGFIDSCNHHCGSWASDLTVGFIDPRVNGIEVGAAFDRWYSGAGTAGTRAWRQGQPFPCRDCCHSAAYPLQCKTDDDEHQLRMLDTVSFGDATSESVHKLDSTGIDISKMAGQPCRTPCRAPSSCHSGWPVGKATAALSVQMRVDPGQQNYLTVKFDGGETSAVTFVTVLNQSFGGSVSDCGFPPELNLCFGTGDGVSENHCADPVFAGRWQYSTMLLPRAQTAGQSETNVTLTTLQGHTMQSVFRCVYVSLPTTYTYL